MSNIRNRKRKTPRRGSTTLEFAVLLPLLMTIALICVDFGRFAHLYIAVTNAARAGAGRGIYSQITPTTMPLLEAAVRQAAEDELTANGWFDPNQLVVPTPQYIDDGSGLRRVRVEVSYPFQTLINWPLLPGYNNPVILRKVVVMRVIR